MLSFITNIANGIMQARGSRAQGASYRTQANLTRLQGQVAKRQADSQAANLEKASEKRLEIAGQEQRTARYNQRLAVGTARAEAGSSGFTSEGTGAQNEQNVQTVFDYTVAQAAQSASIDSMNLWQNSLAARRQGQLAQMAAEIQAGQYDAAAKQSDSAAKNILGSTLIGAGFGLYTGIRNAGQAATAAEKHNAVVTMSADNMGLTGDDRTAFIDTFSTNENWAALTGFDYGAANGFNAVNGLNPWTAGFTRKTDWGGLMSILTGRTPGMPNSPYSLNNL